MMGARAVARALLRRLRKAPPVRPDPAAGEPTWQAVDRPGHDVFGCRLCNDLRELLTFDWAADRARFSRLFAGCFLTLPGLPHVRIEAGDEFSMFQLANPVNGPDSAVPLWYRNSDMVPADDGNPPGTPAPGPAPAPAGGGAARGSGANSNPLGSGANNDPLGL